MGAYGGYMPIIRDYDETLRAALSPYVAAHADNPVDWWEWSDEAFAEAKRRDVPVFLSVGYASCHWCHVMAHESFADEQTAAELNQGFVSIKVDREERPDVDLTYMTAVQALTGAGGWPMSVFLDHKRRPFYGGTYFPAQPRGGMPSFSQLLEGVSDAWVNRRGDVETAAEQITDTITRQQVGAVGSVPADLPEQLAEASEVAVDVLAQEFDPHNGGFGTAPKFPPSTVLMFLLRCAPHSDDLRINAMITQTCEAMARGGLYDQLDGGFSRYCVDANWTVPHFEKMLYDNALLLRVYTELAKQSADPLATRIASETADFLLNRLRTENGGFASSLDADAHDEATGERSEGASYVWTTDQLRDVLGAELGDQATTLLQVSDEGNFADGRSVLQLPEDPTGDWWQNARQQLLAAREQRPQPSRDDKVIASWNGLAIAALAEAGFVLQRPELIEAAQQCAEFLLDVHTSSAVDDGRPSRRLSRSSLAGVVNPSAPGMLEDYAFLAEGLIALSNVTGELSWLLRAGELTETILSQFTHDIGGGFFDSPPGDDQLVRLSDPADLATPSGWSAAAGVLLAYGTVMTSERHLLAAEHGLVIVDAMGRKAPRFAGWLLATAQAYLSGPREVVIVGAPDDPQRAALHAAALSSTAPGLVLAVGTGPAVPAPVHGMDPFADRSVVDDKATAYVCVRSQCRRPVHSVDELRAELTSPTA